MNKTESKPKNAFFAVMDTLPSGLYACCLNTLLDDTESALVRENAALVFATLISYRKPNNELDEKLYPHSAARMGNNWIDLMLRHHNFIGIVQASINRLHVDETINVNSIAANKTVSCNLMRSYCVILTNLLPLKDAGDQNAVFPVMIEIIRSVAYMLFCLVRCVSLGSCKPLFSIVI